MDLDADTLAQQLAAIHAIGAVALKFPQLALQPAEAKQLAKAVAEVAAQYSFVVNPKVQALTGLALVAAGIYAPRAFVFYQMKAIEAAERRKASPLTKGVKIDLTADAQAAQEAARAGVQPNNAGSVPDLMTPQTGPMRFN